MEQRTVVLVVLLFVLIVVGMLGFAYLKNQEQRVDTETWQHTSSLQAQREQLAYLQEIVATKEVVGGVTTLSGTLTLPTPCHQLVTEVQIAESYPEQVVLTFVAENHEQYCAQVLTDVPFSVSFTVSPDARFAATLQGEPILLRVESK